MDTLPVVPAQAPASVGQLPLVAVDPEVDPAAEAVEPFPPVEPEVPEEPTEPDVPELEVPPEPTDADEAAAEADVVELEDPPLLEQPAAKRMEETTRTIRRVFMWTASAGAYLCGWRQVSGLRAFVQDAFPGKSLPSGTTSQTNPTPWRDRAGFAPSGRRTGFLLGLPMLAQRQDLQ
jgi:hypothetical protein